MNFHKPHISLCFALFFALLVNAQEYALMDKIKQEISEDTLEAKITQLVAFKTRHTLSDTLSTQEGIGAARRWIFQEFSKIKKQSTSDFEVHYQKNFLEKNAKRLTRDVWINNVIAIQKGTQFPNRCIIISGDIDSRVSDVNDYTSVSPGANDNATGLAASIESARVLSQFSFENTIIYAALSGEEQGLYGGQGLAKYIQEQGWEVIGVLNNDMIGNIVGIDGTIDNRAFRIFSEPFSPLLEEKERNLMRYYGGDQDGISRQLARKIHRITQEFMPEMKPVLINRLDRLGRGGHHKPFADEGFPAIRIMEMHENYNWQHQDIRMENGIAYGDVLEHVDFNYCAQMTRVNALSLAYLAHAPASPSEVSIQGAVSPSTTLYWKKVKNAKAYKIYWRDTTSPIWQYEKWVGDTDQYTLEGWVIDNYNFGVVAINDKGYESIVAYPTLVKR